MIEPGAVGDFAAIDELQIRHVHPFGQRVIKRHVDVAALAAAFPCEQRLEDGLNAVIPAAMSQTETPTRARAPGDSGDRGKPAFGLHQEIIGLQVAIGPVVAVAGDRAGDEAGMRGAQRGGAEAGRADRSGREILYEHVGSGDHRRKQRRVGGGS